MQDGPSSSEQLRTEPESELTPEEQETLLRDELALTVEKIRDIHEKTGLTFRQTRRVTLIRSRTIKNS